MERRDFIKKSLIIGGAGALCAGCGLLVKKYNSEFFDDLKPMSRKEIEKSPFFYPSEDKLPTCVRFDISTLCNLKCPVCPRFMVSDDEFKKMPQGNMKFEKFKNFLEKHPFIDKISLSSSGEMFFNPEIDQMLEFINSKGLDIYMRGGANLNTVQEDTLANIVKCGVKTFTVSIDGATPETYAIYRVGGDFNRVIENVKIINKYKKQYNSEFPELEYKFVVFGHNEHEIEAAKKLASELNMTIRFDTNYAPNYSPVKNPERVKELTGLNLNYSEHLYEVFKSGEYPWFPCLEISSSPALNINGELQFCCMYKSTTNTGINVFDIGLLNALNHPKVIRFKEVLSDFSKSTKGTPCGGCHMYNLLKKINKPVRFL